MDNLADKLLRINPDGARLPAQAALDSWATAAQQTMKVYEHAVGLRLQMAVADPMSQGRR